MTSGVSRVARVLAALVAGPVLAVSTLAMSSQPAAARSAASSVHPSATGSTLKKHCGVWANWATDLSTQDNRLKFRIWHYVDGQHKWHYCTKVYKVKPQRNKTLIELKAYGYYGWSPTVKTRSSSATTQHDSPEGWYSFVRIKYGSITYQDINLLAR